MILREAVSQIEHLHDEQVIYAAKRGGKWTEISPCILYPKPRYRTEVNLLPLHLPHSGDGSSTDGDYEYMLEVSLAQEVVEAYRYFKDKEHLSDDEKLQAIIYYAENDAYLEDE
jgi:hypothetical protein